MQIAVLGAGTWGLAISNILSTRNDVVLWSRVKSSTDGTCASNLSDRSACYKNLLDRIKSTHDIAQILHSKVLFFAVPAQAVAQVGKEVSSFGLGADAIIVVCTKALRLALGYSLIKFWKTYSHAIQYQYYPVLILPERLWNASLQLLTLPHVTLT